MFILIMYHTIGAGQTLQSSSMSEYDNVVNDRMEIVLARMSSLDASNESERKWCYSTCPAKRLFGITHNPSEDFNIYLAYSQTVTPTLRARIEVSLNRAGIVNLKSLIALRREK